MRNELINRMIMASKGEAFANIYKQFVMSNLDAISHTATEILRCVPPTVGACALMSATWARLLNDQYSVPAIVVAGDLEIKRVKIFRCTENLPESTQTGKIITGKWDGHCWIEIDGMVGDISIFRTAYALNSKSLLKNYIISTFGNGRGVFICKNDDLPIGMNYVPRYVLNDNQVGGLIAGMSYSMNL